jgi:hypothetical protein
LEVVFGQLLGCLSLSSAKPDRTGKEGIMPQENLVEETERLVRREVRSPRSAAIAGILFSLLTAASMILLYNSVTASPTDIGSDWLETWSGPASVVLVLVPFAGIAFLWFTGVIRDLVGDREDRFFATVFLGSGIILVVMMFVWAATVGTIFGTYAVAADVLVDNDIYIYGSVFMNQIIGNYFLRMAGVYMLSIGTLWTRTDVVPRWLVIVTYVVAVGFLLFASATRAARFVFPAWVFLVSVYILIMNYRRTQDQEVKAEPSPDPSS